MSGCRSCAGRPLSGASSGGCLRGSRSRRWARLPPGGSATGRSASFSSCCFAWLCRNCFSRFFRCSAGESERSCTELPRPVMSRGSSWPSRCAALSCTVPCTDGKGSSFGRPTSWRPICPKRSMAIASFSSPTCMSGRSAATTGSSVRWSDGSWPRSRT